MDKNRPEEIESKPYSKDYICNNCHKIFAQTFEFGERASKGACPNCGVADRPERFMHKMFKKDEK